jgi:hypothetical protein
VQMGTLHDDERRRVLVPQALGADEFLRVTWHSQRQVMVFSHWKGAECLAATPVRVSQVGELAELIVTAYTRTNEWPAPDPHALVSAPVDVAQSA